MEDYSFYKKCIIDVCYMARFDGVCCAPDECDISLGVRELPIDEMEEKLPPSNDDLNDLSNI